MDPDLTLIERILVDQIHDTQRMDTTMHCSWPILNRIYTDLKLFDWTDNEFKIYVVRLSPAIFAALSFDTYSVNITVTP